MRAVNRDRIRKWRETAEGSRHFDVMRGNVLGRSPLGHDVSPTALEKAGT